jgi:ribosomal protein S18 acetylase RimI-like enzyme
MVSPDFIIAPATEVDAAGIAAFVHRSIEDAFYRPDLTPEQIAENAWIVDIADRSFRSGIGNPDRITIIGSGAGLLAGFVIADRTKAEYPEIDWLIVAPEFRGQGIAQKLMGAALAWIGSSTPIQLGVIHFNERALAFYRKYGFEDTGRIAGHHKIPRKLLMRPAG